MHHRLPTFWELMFNGNTLLIVVGAILFFIAAVPAQKIHEEQKRIAKEYWKDGWDPERRKGLPQNVGCLTRIWKGILFIVSMYGMWLFFSNGALWIVTVIDVIYRHFRGF